MFLLTNRGGPGCVRLRRVTIGPLKNCASPWAVADELSQGEKVRRLHTRGLFACCGILRGCKCCIRPLTPADVMEANASPTASMTSTGVSLFYTGWFCCMNKQCKTTLVMPARHR
jgi:hypothetical protein